MGKQEFHRFRMQIDLHSIALDEPELPPGYRWQPWLPAQLERHALAKWKCFRSEIDSLVFPCLGNLTGCRKLMSEITRQKFFIPESTWLVVYQPEPQWPSEDCGTIQGVRRNRKLGAIQNVGITPHHRGIGLGRALVMKSLIGFKQAKLRHVCLDVTARNHSAISLYRAVGFRIVKTMIKTVDVPDLVAT